MLWLPVILFIIWFGPLVIWPYAYSLRHRKSPLFYAVMLLCITLNTIPWIWVMSHELITDLLAPLTPLFVVISVLEAWQLNLYALIGSTALLFAGAVLIMLRLSGLKRAISPIVLAIPIVIIPILIQGEVSKYQMNHHFVEMGGDCIAFRSFRESLMRHGDPYQPYHAMMWKADQIFVWSYRKNDWDELPPTGRRGSPPSPSCR